MASKETGGKKLPYLSQNGYGKNSIDTAFELVNSTAQDGSMILAARREAKVSAYTCIFHTIPLWNILSEDLDKQSPVMAFGLTRHKNLNTFV